MSQYDWFWHILTGEPISLSTPLSGSDGRFELGDSLRDTSVPAPDQTVARQRVRQAVRSSLARLGRTDPRLPYILCHRFGIGGAEPMTLQELADRLCLSRERVRQLQNRALRTLRTYLQDTVLEVE